MMIKIEKMNEGVVLFYVEEVWAKVRLWDGFGHYYLICCFGQRTNQLQIRNSRLITCPKSLCPWLMFFASSSALLHFLSSLVRISHSHWMLVCSTALRRPCPFLAGKSLSGWPELIQILEAFYCACARQCCKFPLKERKKSWKKQLPYSHETFCRERFEKTQSSQRLAKRRVSYLPINPLWMAIFLNCQVGIFGLPWIHNEDLYKIL